jgi:general secretion pathway protein I
MTRAARARGFTLLEVLVAIAILGLGLTAILSAQTGLFASSTYTEKLSLATGLVRCKMTEVELKFLKDGNYPLLDMKDEGPCCADEPYGGFRCKWKVEKVLLPNPPTNTFGSRFGASPDSSASAGTPTAGLTPPVDTATSGTGGFGSSGSSFGSGLGSLSSGLGPLTALMSIGQNGSALGQNPALGDVSKMLAGSAPGLGGGTLGGSSLGSTGALGAMGTQILAPLVMGIVYPNLKPMLEASIRKVTVTAEWKEGSRTRDLSVTQFVTNPQQGGLDPNAAEALKALDPAAGGILGGSTTAPTPGGGIIGGGTSTPTGGGFLGGGFLGGGH